MSLDDMSYKTTEKQRAQARKWQKDNPERFKELQRRHGLKHPYVKIPKSEQKRRGRKRLLRKCEGLCGEDKFLSEFSQGKSICKECLGKEREEKRRVGKEAADIKRLEKSPPVDAVCACCEKVFPVIGSQKDCFLRGYHVFCSDECRSKCGGRIRDRSGDKARKKDPAYRKKENKRRKARLKKRLAEDLEFKRAYNAKMADKERRRSAKRKSDPEKTRRKNDRQKANRLKKKLLLDPGYQTWEQKRIAREQVKELVCGGPCGKTKPKVEFHKGQSWCKECANERNKQWQRNHPSYSKEDPEAKRKRDRLRAKKNRERAKVDPEFGERLRATRRRQRAKQKAKNPEKFRERNRKRRAKRMAEDIQFKIAAQLRGRLRSALKGKKKYKKTLELLGRSIEEFKAIIESKWKRGMTWENYGVDWHLDHIWAVSKWDLTTPEGQAGCFHWTNFQPLWAAENIKKSNKPMYPQMSLLLEK